MNTQRKTRSWQGPLFVLLASVCFSTGGIFIKLIPWNALAINGARNLLGAAVIGVYLLMTGHRLVMNRTVLVGALSTMGVTTLFVLANKLTTAANAVVLQFTAPMFVMLYMALFYRIKPCQADTITCAAVLLGVLLVMLDGLNTGSALGNLLAVLSGACYAGVFMMNAGRGADGISSSFWGQLAAGLLLTPLCARETDFSAPTLLAVAALGVIQVGAAYIFLSEGIRRTTPLAASLICGLEPVLNPVWVALFYGERITPLAAVGAVIVIGAIVIYNVRKVRREV